MDTIIEFIYRPSSFFHMVLFLALVLAFVLGKAARPMQILTPLLLLRWGLLEFAMASPDTDMTPLLIGIAALLDGALMVLGYRLLKHWRAHAAYLKVAASAAGIMMLCHASLSAAFALELYTRELSLLFTLASLCDTGALLALLFGLYVSFKQSGYNQDKTSPHSS